MRAHYKRPFWFRPDHLCWLTNDSGPISLRFLSHFMLAEEQDQSLELAARLSIHYYWRCVSFCLYPLWWILIEKTNSRKGMDSSEICVLPNGTTWSVNMVASCPPSSHHEAICHCHNVGPPHVSFLPPLTANCFYWFFLPCWHQETSYPHPLPPFPLLAFPPPLLQIITYPLPPCRPP